MVLKANIFLIADKYNLYFNFRVKELFSSGTASFLSFRQESPFKIDVLIEHNVLPIKIIYSNVFLHFV
jgi:hypothetical protein